MTSSEENEICDRAIFSVLVYLKVWMETPTAVDDFNDFI